MPKEYTVFSYWCYGEGAFLNVNFCLDYDCGVDWFLSKIYVTMSALAFRLWPKLLYSHLGNSPNICFTSLCMSIPIFLLSHIQSSPKGYKSKEICWSSLIAKMINLQYPEVVISCTHILIDIVAFYYFLFKLSSLFRCTRDCYILYLKSIWVFMLDNKCRFTKTASGSKLW